MTTYEEFKTESTLLNVVQRQLDMAVTPFPELVLTGEDLGYLSDLYDTYQLFIDFDELFQERLWAEVDLKKAIGKVWGAWSNAQQSISHLVKVIYRFVCICMILVIEVEWIYCSFSSMYIYICTRVCKYLCIYVAPQSLTRV